MGLTLIHVNILTRKTPFIDEQGFLKACGRFTLKEVMKKTSNQACHTFLKRGNYRKDFYTADIYCLSPYTIYRNGSPLYPRGSQDMFLKHL